MTKDIKNNNYGIQQNNHTSVTYITKNTYYNGGNGSDNDNDALPWIFLVIAIILAFFYQSIMNFIKSVFPIWEIIIFTILTSIVLYIFQSKKINNWIITFPAILIQLIWAFIFSQLINITTPIQAQIYWNSLRLTNLNFDALISNPLLLLFPFIHLILIFTMIFLWFTFLKNGFKKLQNGNISFLFMGTIIAIFIYFSPKLFVLIS